MNRIASPSSRACGRWLCGRHALWLAPLMALAVTLSCAAASAQSVNMQVTVKDFPERRLAIKGTATASNLYPKGQGGVQNTLLITLEYIEPGGTYRVLPDSLAIQRGLARQRWKIAKEPCASSTRTMSPLQG